MQTERHVVTCFLVSNQRLLLLKRSDLVRAYRGRWTAINGSVSADPMTMSVRQIQETTGIAPTSLHLVRRGSPLSVTEKAKKTTWLVHPFLFRVTDPEGIQLTWQHAEHRWVDPGELGSLETVPMLRETLEKVWDDRELGPHGTTGAREEAGTGSPAVRLFGLPDDPELRRDRVGPTLSGRTDRPGDGTEQEGETPSRQGIPVRVVRASSIPNLSGATPSPAAGAVSRKPRGKALLKDPGLHPLLDRLRHERNRGQALLIQRGLEALRTAADRSGAEVCEDLLEDLRLVGRLIADIRPTSASLTHAIALLLYELEFEIARDPSLEHLGNTLDQAVARLTEQHLSDMSQIAGEVSRLISPGATIMTSSYCVPLVEGLQRCNQFGIRVLVLEHHPAKDGRLLARAAVALGKSVTLIVDNAMGLHIQEADMVVIGAEALLADGSAVCDIGAYPLALVADAAGVPFYVAAPLGALDLRPGTAREIVLEEGDPADVWNDPIEGLEVRNVRHERVPSEFITGLITEEGLVQPSSMQQEIRAREHLLDALFDR